MAKDTNSPEAATEAADEPILCACTVLVTGTTYGLAELAAGAKVRLPEVDAKALEKLGKLRIDGI